MMSRILALMGIVGGLALPVPANAAIYYVKAGGSNASTCADFLNACQDLAGAVAKASPNDTIVCFDSGPVSPPATAFTPVNITKSLDIDCHGVTEVIRDITNNPNSAAAITINIPVNPQADPLRTVRLRGISIMGASGVTRSIPRGIDIISAAAVYVENVVISNVVQQGIFDHRTGGQTKLFVTDSTITNNGGAGIVAASAAVGITVVENTRSENNTFGIAVGSGNNVVVNRSVFSGNSSAGVEADAGAQMVVSNSTISHNNIGVQSTSSIRISGNDIAFNNVAVSGNAGTGGGNRFSGNGSLGTPLASASGAPADIGP